MLVSLLGTAGVALPYPVLSPLFLDPSYDNAMTGFLGLPPKILLGFLLALYPLGLIFGGSVIGAMSDICGRKPMLIVSLVAAVAGYGLTGYAAAIESFPLFALARFLTGICEGNIAVSRAIALELHPVINRTRAMSLLYATSYAGWLVGPLAGGYLMTLGVANVFYFAAGITALTVVLVQFAIVRAPGPKQASGATLWETMRKENSLGLLRVREMQPLLIYHFLYTLGLNAFYEFYPLWLVERFQFSSVQIGWGTVSITLAMIICSIYAVTAMENRYGAMGSTRRSSLALGAAFLLLPLVTLDTLYPAFVACGAIIAVANGIFPAYMANRFEEHGLGRVQGLLTTNFCVANVLMALVGSIIALAGTGWALAFGGVLILAASGWLWNWREPAYAHAE
jgi:MFS family permease